MQTLREIQREVHATSMAHGFWDGPEQSNIPTKLALIHEEISEALQAYRESNMHFYFEGGPGAGLGKPEGFGIELADAIIRICDLAEALGINLEEMVTIKATYNQTRPYMHGRRV